MSAHLGRERARSSVSTEKNPQVEAVTVPAGPLGVRIVAERLAGVLQQASAPGAPIALIPEVGPNAPQAVVARIRQAVQPDRPADRPDVAVVVATSGSTGQPRGVLHSVRSLQALTPAVHARLTTTPTWISALPLTSMGGLNVLVRALATDRLPVAIASLGGAAPFQARDVLEAIEHVTAPIAISLVAAQVDRLLDDPDGVAALRACDLILVGGGATPTRLRTRAAEQGITLTRTYGSTETSGGCVVDGRALPGVLVKAGSSAEHPDRIVIDGPMLALGYRGDPMLTERVFTAQGLLTDDVGYVSDDGTLTVIGRRDDVVVIRGVNVSLPAIAASATAAHPCVAIALSDSAHAEPRVVVCIAAGPASDGASDLQPDTIKQRVRASLGPPAVPAAVLIVDDLPMLPSGKPDRQALAAMARAFLDAGPR